MVPSSTSVFVAASLLRIHQIDALPVVDTDGNSGNENAEKAGESPAFFHEGREDAIALSGYSVLSKLLSLKPTDYYALLWRSCKTASQAAGYVSADENVEALLSVFERSGFGFAVVRERDRCDLVTLRDMVSLYAEGVFASDLTVKEIASPVFSVAQESKIRDVLLEMFKRRIRRVVIIGTNSVVSDREVVSHVFSPERLNAIKETPEALLEGSIEHIHAATHLDELDGENSVKDAALLISKEPDCILVNGGGIVTPWDLIIKPFRSKRLHIKS